MSRNSADVVVIGAGVVGASVAFELARAGCKNVVLIEKATPAAGSTGRCGAGVRQQFGTRHNCILAREAVRIFEKMDEYLDYRPGVEFRQSGYLMVAYSDHEWNQFKKNVELERSLDIDVKTLTPEEARGIVPFLSLDRLVGATFCQEDGHANPFHTTFAYVQAARRLGVEVQTHTSVIGIETSSDRIQAVVTDKGRISTNTVVNCAGARSGEIASMAGIDLPVYGERHQILITEPVNACMGPMVISFHHDFYCQQTPHGSFIMGVGMPGEPKSFNIRSSVEFLDEMARKLVTILPPLAELRVVRQWAGLYDRSPDAQPILGECPPVHGFYNANGFSGHGFMLAPIVGVLLSELILTGKTSIPISMLDAGRFARGELVLEPTVVG
ncbi:MAG: FAD-binding oxidoreductase [Clostridia bacterium]|nr:FAD-binding oxidoreductase [Clostridia bacterium]